MTLARYTEVFRQTAEIASRNILPALSAACDLIWVKAPRIGICSIIMMDDVHLLFLAARLAEEAGAAILAVRASGYKVAEKSDRSPVTDADIVSQQVILAGLKSATPDIPVVAEELPANATGPLRNVFWMVDPLDGTREFAAGRDEFVVNIGLVRDHKVVLGAVAAPARHEVFTGIVGQGAWKRSDGREMPIHVRNVPSDGAIALISRHDANDQGLPSMLAKHKVANTIKMGSGLKFCWIAEGQADLYVRPGRTMEWDTAAPHAVLEAAGGIVMTTDCQPLIYGKPDWENPSFACVGQETAKAGDPYG